ncbi:MAG: fasciclin domain-containing protein [Polyangiaceae bacterium]
MKYLPWLTAMFVACQPLIACSSDSNDTESSAGAPSAGRAGGTAGSPSAGAPSGGKGGALGAAGAAAGEGGSGGAGVEAGAGGSAGASQAKDIVETAIAAGSFTKLAAALTTAGLVETLQGPGPFTVFAPDDAAFAAFETANPGVLAGLSKADLTTILTYHVVAGSAASKDLKNNQVFTTVSGSPVLIDKTAGVKLTDGAKVDDATVTTADIVASNGIIHVINFIITPPAKDIVETAVAAGTFTKLAGALTSASLVDTLKGKGPFTVFAPTDAAFAGVTPPTGTALANLLKYHVVGAAAGSGDLSDKQALTTLDTATTSKLTVDLTAGVKIIDSTATPATVAPANILAKNGVIHVIDKVLIPQ